MGRVFKRLVVALFLGVLSAAPVAAQPAPAAPQVWGADTVAEAQRLLTQAQTTLRSGRMVDLAPQTDALEQALLAAAAMKTGDGAPVLLHDNVAEPLMLQIWLKMPEAAAVAARSPRLVRDPYPTIAYLLGFYFNEFRQPDRAVRALSAGIAELKTHIDWRLTDTAPMLLIEMGAAHNIAGRYQAAYDAYSQALSLPGAKPEAKAKIYRGMGFTLVEMNRLGDAETAYRESLKLEPDDAGAKRELAYIANLKTGAPQQAPTLDGKPFGAGAAQ